MRYATNGALSIDCPRLALLCNRVRTQITITLPLLSFLAPRSNSTAPNVRPWAAHHVHHAIPLPMAQIQGSSALLHVVGINPDWRLSVLREHFHRSGNIDADPRRLHTEALGIPQSRCRPTRSTFKHQLASIFAKFSFLVPIDSIRFPASFPDTFTRHHSRSTRRCCTIFSRSMSEFNCEDSKRKSQRKWPSARITKPITINQSPPNICAYRKKPPTTSNQFGATIRSPIIECFGYMRE